MLLAVLAISVGSLAPILPGQSLSAVEQKTIWCAQTSMNRCHGCPINSGGATSACGYGFCAGPSACLCLYFNHGDDFATNGSVIDMISLNNDRIAARAQRPPVPPPRIAFS